MQELDALQAALNKALDTIREELSIQGLPELSSTAEEQHPLDDPTFLSSPRLFEARRLALSCVGQLHNLLQVPYEKVVEQSFAVYDTACLNIVVNTGILDRLAESSTLSVSALSKALDLHPVKVATVLRYLATQEFKLSTLSVKTAFQLSHDTVLSLFDYLKCHPSELEQWSKSVRSLGTASEMALINDYPWESLEPGVFVDCGGGHGQLSILLSRKLKNTIFVIQDLPEVIPIAEKNVRHDCADLCEQGRLIIEAHDFFQVQPRKAEVYVFRYILHNWSNLNCVTILKNTARAAHPQSRFLIIEFIPQRSGFTTKEQNGIDSALDDFIGVTEYRPLTPPPFVPLNFGSNAKMHSALGVHMMGVFNAAERYLVNPPRMED
ncbi:putative O-methyltransferase [Mycena sanguinolenta]|uniref:Putative O-methyltransferase n=1 Tax=Mycena sanguinolenta TaxID=230812 RepID=A0A8H7DFH6_9AGAR|nr:putative O-methyltransferase [Mycena sanguinolenta]